MVESKCCGYNAQVLSQLMWQIRAKARCGRCSPASSRREIRELAYQVPDEYAMRRAKPPGSGQI
jgi:hypothetical protein